jgi:hypothetical protein
MAKLNFIVIDCQDADKMAAFWSQALDGYELHKEEWGVTMTSETQPPIYFQPVPEGKQVKNRLHLNITSTDRAAEVQKLVGLGATEEDTLEPGGGYIWTNMLDVEGNEFCVSPAQ